MRKLLIASMLGIMSFGGPAPASAATYLTGFATMHLAGHGWCDVNPGAGIEFDNGFAVGVYKNSLCRTSVYIAKEFAYSFVPAITGGVLVGAVTGYRWKITPVVLPEIVFRLTDSVKLAALIQPITTRIMPAFVAVQLRYSF
ncbi:MAG: hypothetical protein EPN34_14745 [Burkholderiaceae bacterium]|nr:MAG: hypothetical protein EPN34_14745 [Burkholderiaceae bacterium]